jgi:hypothetical protein
MWRPWRARRTARIDKRVDCTAGEGVQREAAQSRPRAELRTSDKARSVRDQRVLERRQPATATAAAAAASPVGVRGVGNGGPQLGASVTRSLDLCLS